MEQKNNLRKLYGQSMIEVEVPTNPHDHLVQEIPLLDQKEFVTQHWAGLLPASDDKTKYLFYWLFAPADSEGQPLSAESDMDAATKNKIPLLIWLNGGPACSSMDGLFLENGPFRFVLSDPNNQTSAYKLTPAQYSWHKLPAYTLYIDQPVGTGLSFVQSGGAKKKKKYPSNDEEVNIDFYYFLQQFFRLHTDKFVTTTTTSNYNTQQLNRPFYFSGESHSGHYIPSMMSYILQKNEEIMQQQQETTNTNNNHDTHATNETHIILPLTGAAIGNGWMDPYHQYAAGRAAYGHGIVDDAQLNALNEKEKVCQQEISKGQYAASVACNNLLDEVVAQSNGASGIYKVCQYDVAKVQLKNGKRTFPLGYRIIEGYLGGPIGKHSSTMFTTSSHNREDDEVFGTEQVLQSIHAYEGRLAGQIYQECTDPPFDALSGQDALGVVDDVINLLNYEGTIDKKKKKKKIQLLFFNGMNDLICNHVGNEIFLTKMKWNSQSEWISSQRYAWTAPSENRTGKINGYMKEYDNLLFLKLLDSGHMVPVDIPNIAFDMMTTFLSSSSGSRDNALSSSSFLQSVQKLKSLALQGTNLECLD